MNKKLYMIPLLLLFACLPLVAAQTYLYHATVTESGSGNLTGTVPVGGAVYLKMALDVSGLEPFESNGNLVSLAISNSVNDQNSAWLYAVSDGFLLYANSHDGDNMAAFYYFYEMSVSGTETVIALFDSENHVVTLWVNGTQVYTDTLTFTGVLEATTWSEVLDTYESALVGTGSFEAWVSLTDPTPTPTPTATPTAAPTSTPWVNNTAIPIGGNIGGLNTIILLLLLGGVGLSVTLLIVSKLKSNIIEAIIIMMILGTAGIVALLWLIGGFT